jgi:rhomboid family GlyGly-CTERM serine protease
MRSRPLTAFVVVLSLLATVLALALPSVGAHLLCDLRAIERGELWRLLSGPLVHTGIGHALRDLACLAAIGIVYERELGWRFAAALFASTVVPPVVAFVVTPSGGVYYGLSAAVYGLAAAAVVAELRRDGLRAGLVTLALALAVAVTLGYELVSGTELLGVERAVANAPGAHLAGALSGLVVGWSRGLGPGAHSNEGAIITP